MIDAASEGINEAIKINESKIMRLSTLQLSLYFVGILFYIIWQLIDMTTLLNLYTLRKL
jgi:hypothetical protein